MSIDQLQAFYNARTTLLELLSEQGFNTDAYEHFSMSELTLMLQANEMKFTVFHRNNDTKTFIYFMTEPKFKKNIFNLLVTTIYEQEDILRPYHDMMIVVTLFEDNLSLHSMLSDLWQKRSIFVVTFPLQHLQFNILKHKLVPPHHKLSLGIIDENKEDNDEGEEQDNEDEAEEEKELDDLKKRFHFRKLTELPRMSRFDPVAKAIGLRPGELVKIHRPSHLTGKDVVLRICVNKSPL